MLKCDCPSGVASTFVSPCGERTFGTYLGASAKLCADDLSRSMFEGYSYFYIEGYLLQDHDLIVRAMQLAKEAGLQICLDMASYNVVEAEREIFPQRSDRGAGAKRARYNSALIDANVTEPGDQYEDLNETFVIFITENDVMKAGLPIYHIDRVVRETGKLFEDEEHIIYVNSQIKDETKLGRLMHDFSCTDAKDMYNKVLADRVRYFKEDERGVEIMCREMEIMRNQAHEEGIEKGRIMQLIKQVCVKNAENFSSAEEVANDLVEQDVPLIPKNYECSS